MPIGAFKLNSIARYLIPAATGRTAKTVTGKGGYALMSTAQSQFGGSSLGVTQTVYSFVNATNVLTSSTANFTIEFWFRHSGSGNGHMMNWRGDNWPGFAIFISGTSVLIYAGATSGVFDIFSGVSIGTFSANTWTHCAVVRNGSSFKGYLNGTETSIGTSSSAIYANGDLCMGGWATGTTGGTLTGQDNPFTGYIDEVRISSSVRYTAAFTPSTSEFVNDANTALLLHMNGTDGTNYFIDDNGVRSSNSIISNGDAQVSTAQSQFGSASALFDGSNDYMTVANTAGTLSLSGDFTIECWIRMPATAVSPSNNAIWSCADHLFYIARYNPGGGFVYEIDLFQGGFNRVTSGTGVTLNNNQWYHIAITRSSGSCRIFVNGTQTGTTTTYTATLTSASPNEIGRYGAGYWNVYIDEFRISNSARYTTTFTPSATAFVNDADTLLLIHADGPNNAKVFYDDNGGTYATIPNPPVTLLGSLNPANSTATTITIPADALVGDIAILSDSSTTTTLTVPSGWTQISTATTTGIRTTVSYRVLTSGDPGSSVTGMAGTTRKVMKILRPSASNYTLSLSTPTTQATTAAPTAQTISGNSTTTADAYIATYGSTGSIATRTFTQSGYTADESGALSTSSVYQKITIMNQQAASSASISMSDNGTNTLQGVRITLTST
jgi:hypothetical protein